MACERPNYLIDYGPDVLNGKHKTRFLAASKDLNYRNLAMLKHYNNDGITKVYPIPCGKCPSCIKSYRRSWSIRCEAEARLYNKNCFITLTYDESHNDGLLHREHLVKFIKSLRNRGISIRYFGCGEYSPDKRPHYHIILFGYMPDDLSLISKSKKGFYLFKSPFITSLWSKGLCTIQEFDSGVAAYVAGYVDKKLDDNTGFLMMSNRPGIGHDYFIKNLFKLYQNDNYISKNGYISSLPRYVDKLADAFFMDISDVKEKRSLKQNDFSIGELNEHNFAHFEQAYMLNGDLERSKRKYARSL